MPCASCLMPFAFLIMYDICIIGGGAAGLFACVQAASGGIKTAMFEKNTAAGRKLLITGGGRCNLTHLHKPKEFIDACEPYSRFLRHCIYEFSPQDTIDFFNSRGLPTICQADGCVFPQSQKASDVRDLLTSLIKRSDAHIFYDKPVTTISRTNEGFIVAHKAGQITAKSVIIATGGLSYPKTGSTGDGYTLAQSLGHTITAVQSCLVPLIARQYWVGKLAGVGVSNCGLLETGDKKKNQITGPLIFTDDGIGGPAVINFSRRILPKLAAGGAADITIDLIAGGTIEDFTAEFNGLCQANPKKDVSQLLSGYFSRSLISMLAELACVDLSVKAAQFSKPGRTKLIAVIKSMPLTITGTKPIEQATVTRGGVSTGEINPLTMESKICPGLFFAGEVIDADAPCGGYNLQIAFSTAALAAKSASANLRST